MRSICRFRWTTTLRAQGCRVRLLSDSTRWPQVTSHVLTPRSRTQHHIRAITLLLEALHCLHSCGLDLITGVQSASASEWSGTAACMEQRGVNSKVRDVVHIKCPPCQCDMWGPQHPASVAFRRSHLWRDWLLRAPARCFLTELAHVILARVGLHAGGRGRRGGLLDLHRPSVLGGCLQLRQGRATHAGHAAAARGRGQAFPGLWGPRCRLSVQPSADPFLACHLYADGIASGASSYLHTRDTCPFPHQPTS